MSDGMTDVKLTDKQFLSLDEWSSFRVWLVDLLKNDFEADR